MTFVSYAQNYEDVMLWRAFKDIRHGFYVDVGANDPTVDSVTKAFYEQGWRGINIEPVTQWYEKIRSERPEDVNLQIAVSDQPGMLSLYEVMDTGLSTVDPEISKRYQDEGFSVREIKVPALTLNAVLKDYPNQEIHFLKVDVEGSEKRVLQGLDLNAVRPWIVLVESTEPNSQIENYGEWESILLGANYEFTYFDGLNRFYVATEHSELKNNFRTPPNFFDHFIGRQLLETQINLVNTKDHAKWLENEREFSKKKYDESQALIQSLEEKLTQTYNHAQWLQSQWDFSSAKFDESQVTIKALEDKLTQTYNHAQWLQSQWDFTNSKFDESQATIKALEDKLTQTYNHAQWLQSQWDFTNSKFDESQVTLKALEDKLTQTYNHTQWLQSQWDFTNSKFNESQITIQIAKNKINEAQEAIRINEDKLINVYNHAQWLQGELDGIKSKPSYKLISAIHKAKNYSIKYVLGKTLLFVLSRPRLRKFVNRAKRTLMNVPVFYKWIIRVENKLIKNASQLPLTTPVIKKEDIVDDDPLLQTLTPKSKKIYQELKKSIAQQAQQ